MLLPNYHQNYCHYNFYVENIKQRKQHRLQMRCVYQKKANIALKFWYPSSF